MSNGLSKPLPIVVDLDGTLTPVDTLHEQITRLFLRQPFRFFITVWLLVSSRARFKSALTALSGHSRELIPWNHAVSDRLAKAGHSQIYLCTASNQERAAHLTREFTVFAEVIGSTADRNLKGSTKAKLLRSQFGHRGFIYYGNAFSDVPVWAEAAEAVVVSNDSALVAKAREVCPVVNQLPVPKAPFFSLLFRQLRPHQWTKNLLLLVPIVTSHRFTETPLLLTGALSFVVFCLISSAVYVINDLIDLDADRRHPTKSRRPFASGELSVLYGLPIAALLLIAGLAGAATVNVIFAASCAGYVVLALFYSALLKKIALLDVFALASLYTLRLVAGGAATGIPISVWLAAFSIFIFLSLALCKRYSEIVEHAPSSGAEITRRGYAARDASFVLAQGLIYMGCATLVLAVYLSSSTVTLLYRSPSLLWAAVLVVSYWGGRLWLLATRREMDDDPVFFALRDPVSWACFALLVAVFFAAMKLG